MMHESDPPMSLNLSTAKSVPDFRAAHRLVTVSRSASVRRPRRSVFVVLIALPCLLLVLGTGCSTSQILPPVEPTPPGLDATIEAYDAQISKDPSEPRAYLERGHAYRASGDLDQALVDYTRTIDLDPKNAAAYAARGLVHYAQGNNEKAISDYSRAIQMDPENATAYQNRGIAYYDEGATDQAIQDYTQALELRPELIGTYYNRGLAYYVSGQTEAAKADLQMFLELSDDDYGREKANTLLKDLERR